MFCFEKVERNPEFEQISRMTTYSSTCRPSSIGSMESSFDGGSGDLKGSSSESEKMVRCERRLSTSNHYKRCSASWEREPSYDMTALQKEVQQNGNDSTSMTDSDGIQLSEHLSQHSQQKKAQQAIIDSAPSLIVTLAVSGWLRTLVSGN